MLGESFHITSEYPTQEAKITSSMSRLEALEAKNSKLKKDLITAMDEANSVKEKVKSLGDDLRAERQLELENDEQLLAVGRSCRSLLPRPSRVSSKLRSTVLCSLVGTSRTLSFSVGT